MKRSFLLLALTALSTLAISAGTLVPGPADTNPDTNFTATVDLTLGTITLATPTGPDTLTVFGVGNLFATDNGTPGQVILGVNTGLSEEISLTFNTALGQILSGVLVIPATGAAVTSITDPALAALIGSSNFSFASAGSEANPFVFDFTSADLPMTGTPEPAVAFTVGVGLLGISALRLRKRAN
jgi:hypothetical protein